MRLLASILLSSEITEIGVAKVPRGVKRGMQQESEGNEAKLTIAGTSLFLASQFETKRIGNSLLFIYTGPQAAPGAIEESILKLFVPRRFNGFTDLRYLID